MASADDRRVTGRPEEVVIARSPCDEAIQSEPGALDCFASLAMTNTTRRDRPPRHRAPEIRPASRAAARRHRRRWRLLRAVRRCDWDQAACRPAPDTAEGRCPR